MTLRGDILAEAARLCDEGGDRHRDYGDPLDNFEHIARIVNAITGHSLTAPDITLVLHSVKLARLAKSPEHTDSYIDGCAYLALTYECVKRSNACPPNPSTQAEPNLPGTPRVSPSPKPAFGNTTTR